MMVSVTTNVSFQISLTKCLLSKWSRLSHLTCIVSPQITLHAEADTAEAALWTETMKRGSCSLTLEVLEVLCLFSLPAPSNLPRAFFSMEEEKCHVQVLTDRHSQNSTVHSTNCKCCCSSSSSSSSSWYYRMRSEGRMILHQTQATEMACTLLLAAVAVACASPVQPPAKASVRCLCCSHPLPSRKLTYPTSKSWGKSSTQKCPSGMGDASSQRGG